MRAELDASLCIPQDQPIKAKVDPSDIDVRLSGTPGVTVSPVAFGLPTVSVTIPNITFTPPSLNLSLDIGFGTDQLANYITSIVAALNLIPVTLNPLDPATILWAALLPAVILGAGKAILTPEVSITAALVPGPITLQLDKPFSVSLGEFSLHGLQAAGNNQPMTVTADLGNTGVAAKIEPTTAELSGCVVLNGGDPPCAPHPPHPHHEPPPAVHPVVRDVEKKRGADAKQLLVTVHGQALGVAPGVGSVVLKTTSATHTPTAYALWSDNLVTALFSPVPPNGNYVLVVTGSSGLVANVVPLTLP